jgi:hypothetical protein
MTMGPAVGIAITLGVIFAYLYINWFIGTRVTGFIAGLFTKENDDEVIGYDEDSGMGRSVWSPVTRADQRFKYWFFLVMVPLLVYVNYKFWDKIWATMEFVANTSVHFAAQFVT